MRGDADGCGAVRVIEERLVPGVGTLWWSRADVQGRAARGDGPERAAQAHRSFVIPADGSADLILRDDELLVAGPSTRAIHARGGTGGVTVGLRFAPGAAGVALAQHAAPLRDGQLAGASVLTPAQCRAARDLLRRVRDGAAAEGGADRASRVRHIEHAFAPEIAAHAGWHAAVRRAAARGHSAPQLAVELGYSERQLRRRLTEHFGYGFASLRRVVRAERALALLRAGWAPGRVAAQSGYADQSHLTRDFVALVGATPGELAAYAAGSAA